MNETEHTEEIQGIEDSPEDVLEALMQEESAALMEDSDAEDPFAARSVFGTDPGTGSRTRPGTGDAAAADNDDDAAVVEDLLAEFSEDDAHRPLADAARATRTTRATQPPAFAADDDLDVRASEVARALMEAEDQADLEREAETLLARATTSGAAAEIDARRHRKRRQDRILIGLLLANLSLMGLMLALPSTSEPSRGQTPEVNRPAGDPGAQPGVPGMPGPDPFRAPLQEPDEVLPNSEIYKTAQIQIAKGNPTRALELFERYLKAHPELQAHQLQLVYSNMAYCLNSLGRRQDAQAYGAKIDNLRNITALPDDLWESAHRAENDGRGIDMRRYYARFLLQQDQLGKRWASQGKIAEAYMKIGDSYRIDAEKGSQVEALRANINRNLKKPDGAPRPKPPTGEVDNKQKGKQAAGKQAAGKQGGGH